jgi:hypothetical protein
MDTPGSNFGYFFVLHPVQINAFKALWRGLAPFHTPLRPCDNIQLRARLVALAADKPICQMEQYDVFVGIEPGDPIVVPDEDGDCLFSTQSWELRNSGPEVLRVQIPSGFRRQAAIRALEKILEFVRADNASPTVGRSDRLRPCGDDAAPVVRPRFLCRHAATAPATPDDEGVPF